MTATAGKLLGDVLHTVQDAFSPSHVERYSDGSVKRYQDYGDQDHAAHSRADQGAVMFGSFGGRIAARDATRDILNILICKKNSASEVEQYMLSNVLRHDHEVIVGGAAPGIESE